MAFKSKKILTVGLAIVFGLVIFGGLARGVGAATPEDPRSGTGLGWLFSRGIALAIQTSPLSQLLSYWNTGHLVQINAADENRVSASVDTIANNVGDTLVTSEYSPIGYALNTAAINQENEAAAARLASAQKAITDAKTDQEKANAAELLRMVQAQNQTEAEVIANNKKNVTDQGPPAGSSSNTLSDLLGLAVSYFLYFIAYGLGVIMMIAIKVMLTIATYNNFLDQPAVQVGWTIVRDVCNNFFIVLMLMMAVGTALNFQSYQWRAMLPKILIMAVLINFSKLATGLMIDASQILMLTFAAPLATSTAYNIILASFGLPSFMQLSDLPKQLGDINGGGTLTLSWWDIIAALLFAIIVTIAALVVIIVIAITLAYRIVMLWFLVILSPAWIFGMAFKQGSGISSKWQNEITNYLIVGPAMMFFLYLSFMTLSTINMAGAGSPDQTNVLKVDTTTANTELNNTNFSGGDVALTSGNDTIKLSNMASPNGMINVLIVIGLLWASLMMGKKYGSLAANWSNKGMGWLQKYTGANLAKSLPGRATKAAKATAGFAATAVDDKLGVRSRLYSGIYKAGGRFVPGLNTYLGGKVGTLEGGRAKRRQAKLDATATASGMGKMTQTQLRSMANSLTATPDQKRAAFQTMMKNGWINDDDKDNSGNNIKLINAYRSSLPPELLNTFDNNLKKSNAALAFQSSIYGGGSDRAKIEEDIKMGRLKLDALMKNADNNVLESLRKMNGGDNDGLMKWLVKNAKDDKEFGTIMAGLSSAAKDTLSGNEKDDAGNIVRDGIKADVFASKSTGTAEEKKRDQKKLDKMREAYIKSAKDFRFDDIFDVSDDAGKEKRDNFVSANQSFIASEAGVGQLEKLMKSVGHVFDPQRIEQITQRGSEFEKKLQDVFKGIAESLEESDLTGVDKDKAKKKMENALIAGAEVNFEKSATGPVTNARRNALIDILSGKNKGKVLDNLAADNIDSNFLRSAVTAGLSSTDYGKLDAIRVKGGFDSLAAQVETDATINDAEAAKIVEQALINGSKVDLVSGAGGDRRRRAYQTAMSGSKRHEILKNMSHENISSDFVNNGGIDSLSAKEISDLSNMSVDHRSALQSGIKDFYNNTLGRIPAFGGIAGANKSKVQDIMSKMATAGSYVRTGRVGGDTVAFRDMASSLKADTLKNFNLVDDVTGVVDTAQAGILAEKVSLKELLNFLQSGQNKQLRDEIINAVRNWSTAGLPLSAGQTQKVNEFRRNGLI